MINLDPHNLINLKSEDFKATTFDFHDRMAEKIHAFSAPRDMALAFRFLGRHLPKGKILIHGAGEHSRLLIPALEESQSVIITGIIDRNYIKLKEFCGYQVIPLQEAINRDFDYILVANFIHEIDMVRELVSMGVPAHKIFPLYSNPAYYAEIYNQALNGLIQELPENLDFVILNDASGVFDTRTLTRFLPPERTLILQDFPRDPNLFYPCVDTKFSLQLIIDLLRHIKPKVIYVRTFMTYEYLAFIARTACPTAMVIHEMLDLALLAPDAQVTETGCMTPYALATARLAEVDSFLHSDLILTKRSGPVFDHVITCTGASYSLVFPWLTDFKGEERSSPVSPQDGEKTRIKVVYAGQLYPAAMQDVLKGEWNYYPLFRKLVEEGDCTVDIFNSLHKTTQSDERFGEFMLEDSDATSIRYHRAVTYGQVGKRLAAYDYGFFYTEFPNDQNLDRSECVSARFTGYVNSGLPMIISDGVTYMASLIRKFDAGIVLRRYDASQVVPTLRAAHVNHSTMRDGVRRLHTFMLENNERVIQVLQETIIHHISTSA